MIKGKLKPLPLKLSNQVVIGVIGTAPKADSSKFPLDVPILIAGSEDEVLNNLLGGFDVDTDRYMGCHAFKVAKGSLGVCPKVLITPGFSDEAEVVNELVKVADVLGASVIADGPNTNDADVLKYVGEFVVHGNVSVFEYPKGCPIN